MTRSVLAQLPGVDVLLEQATDLVRQYGHTEVTGAIRRQLDSVRQSVLCGKESGIPDTEALLCDIATQLQHKHSASLKPVMNLTGTVLHTNLGRARLPQSAIDAMQIIGRGYSNLEFDLSTGKRGDRDDHIEALIQEITGAEAATVVNNNAAAVLLVLSALASGREVPVSRGELVEIGGSFRIPDVMTQSGCRLKEIGTTNRTHARDYESAIGDNTALLMKVHTSNYEINGFTQSVPDEQVAVIAHRHQLPFVTDLGSGTLVELSHYGLPHETTVQESVEAGADIITFSGDKLLGGPQCGFIVGKRTLIDTIKAHPLKRALRIDKITMAALTEVLKLYLRPEQLAQNLPALRDLCRPIDELQSLAAELADQINVAGYSASVTCTESQIGSGALPTRSIPSMAVCFSADDGKDQSIQKLERACRSMPVPVIGRIHDSKLLLDVRTLDEPQILIDQLAALKL